MAPYVTTTMIYTHVLNRGGLGVTSPADLLGDSGGRLAGLGCGLYRGSTMGCGHWQCAVGPILVRQHTISHLSTGNALLQTPRAFISYRWESDAHTSWVTAFASALSSRGVTVSLDHWIQGARTDDATVEVISQIVTCHAFLPILTIDYLAAIGWRNGEPLTQYPGNRWVFDEFQLALGNPDSTEIIPVLREGDLDRLPYDWNRANTLDVRTPDRYETLLDRLASYLHNERQIAWRPGSVST